MIPAVIGFLALLILSAAFAAVSWVMAFQLTPESKRPVLVRWLIPWSIKGLLTPTVLWAVMNLGLSWTLQPFMPQVQAAQNSGRGWVPEFVGVLGSGMLLVSSYWTALTLGWLLWSTVQGVDGETRKDFKALCWTCLLGLSIPAVFILLLGGWPTLGLATSVILAPMAGYGAALLRPRQTPPMYARAIARIKFGKYAEAEWEIIRELEKAENDFEGWMMLAELYANQFNDLAEAERTILELCDQPKLTTSQLSMALHKLADWQLKLADDPDAARRALQMVIDRLRGTHLAHMAQLRLNQLPATAEDLREERTGKPIPLPALGDHLDDAPVHAETAHDSKAAAQAANACVERLKRDPNNIAAREKLARIFAEQLERADLGIEQLMLLLDLPEQPESKRAEWLGLTAAWHIKYRHDLAAGRRTLERLLQEFPHTPQALAARRRLELMDTQPTPPS